MNYVLKTRIYEPGTSNIIEFLESQLAEIEGARYDVCEKTDTSLQQIIDNIVQLYLSTLYKLRFLAWNVEKQKLLGWISTAQGNLANEGILQSDTLNIHNVQNV